MSNYFKVFCLIKSIFILLLICFLPLFSLAANKSVMTDEQIKQKIIKQSISNYPGSCPCPYHYDRADRKCGKRSAYSRVGGYEPLCYPKDVTPRMIEQYRSF